MRAKHNAPNRTDRPESEYPDHYMPAMPPNVLVTAARRAVAALNRYE